MARQIFLTLLLKVHFQMCCPEAEEIPGANMNFSGGWDLSTAGLEDTKETEKAIF